MFLHSLCSNMDQSNIPILLLLLLTGCIVVQTELDGCKPLTRFQKIERRTYNLFCSTLAKLPTSLTKLPFKSRFFQKRLVKLHIPNTCGDVFLKATYPSLKTSELKKLKDSKLPVVWVIGGPGAGKGTLCKTMAEKKADGSGGYTHISVGELIRKQIDDHKNSFSSTLLHYIIYKKAELIPQSVSMTFLAQEMLSKIDNSKGFLIDGFPRSLGQAIAFQEQITPPDVIVSLEASDETLKQRILNRKEGRADDNEETLRGRLRTFHENQPQITSNNKFSSKVQKIDAEKTKDEIVKQFTDIINKVLADKTSAG